MSDEISEANMVTCLCCQWAKIIIVLEKSYSPKQLLKFQEEYSVPWIAEPSLRALMVIKTDKKTKARQRKGAIANWKVWRSINTA